MMTDGHQTGGSGAAGSPENSPAPTISGVALGPFETNCYLVRFPGSPECWIIDAGYEPAELIELVKRQGLRPVALILTHAHCDHIAGVREVVGAFPGLPIIMHRAEAAWLNDPLLNLSAMTGMPVTAPEATQFVADGDVLTLRGQAWRVLHTPGHSPGGITLWHEPSAIALVGDTLFAGSVGRTDFPGSDAATLAASIREKLYRLPDGARVYPGHGPETTIGREKRTNPFVRA